MKIRRLHLAAASTFAMALWAYGCSSDNHSSDSGLGRADPGGTFGVQSIVRVTGAGRVRSDPASIDCPGTCTSTLIFDPSAAGPKEVVLSASASTGWRFAGWDFESTDSPGHGRGADPCNPIVRRTAAPPGADPASNVIKLAAGEQEGTPPQGQDCAGVTKVPMAYSATAKFVKVDEVPDAGSEGTPLYACPSGAVGKKIFARDSQLYWQCDVGSQSTIWYGSSAGSGTPSVFVSPGVLVTQFQIDAQAVYEYQGPRLFTRSLSSITPTELTGGPSPCSAVASDGTNAYCRGSNALHRWPLTNPGTQLANGLPVGVDLAVDNTGPTTFFFSGPANIFSLALANLDGGTTTPTTLASATSPSGVQVGTSYVYWLSLGSISAVLKTGGTPFSIQSRGTIRSFVIDPGTGSIYFLNVPSTATGASSVEKTASTGTASTVVKSGITNPVALAVDSSYVYWISGDGRVFRNLK